MWHVIFLFFSICSNLASTILSFIYNSKITPLPRNVYRDTRQEVESLTIIILLTRQQH